MHNFLEVLYIKFWGEEEKKKISEKNKKKNKTSLENVNQKQYFVKKKSPSEKSRIATWTSFLCEVWKNYKSESSVEELDG